MNLREIQLRAHLRARGSYLGHKIRRAAWVIAEEIHERILWPAFWRGALKLQHDQNIANADGATVRADINNALAALFSLSSGATAPSTTVAYQLWADTTNNLLKQRNAANTGWLVRGTLAEAFVIARSSNTILGVSDFGKTFAATSTFTQTLTAAATLGDGWTVCYRNAGTGAITIDPNSSETIDGATSIVLQPGEACVIVCNGSAFHTIGRAVRVGVIAAGRNIAARTNATTPNSKLDMTADEIAVKDANGQAKILASISVTGDMAASGANGLDTGVEASGTWYYGWVIAKEDGTVAALISASSSAPTLPSGYTYKALVSAVRNDGSSNFIKYRQLGNEIYYEAGQSALAAGGAAATTAASLAAQVPPVALSARLGIRPLLTSSAGGSCTEVFQIEIVAGSSFMSYRVDVPVASFNSAPSSELEIPNLAQNVNYYWQNIGSSANVSARSGNIDVHGFKLPMGGE